MSTAGRPIRLLIVDDHPVVPVRGLADGLRGVFTGDPDFEAADGDEAVATVERIGADVVLMDLRMPRMGGVEAIARLRGTAPSAREGASKLFVSEATIKTHLLHIYDKLGVRDRAGAVGEAYKRRLLP